MSAILARSETIPAPAGPWRDAPARDAATFAGGLAVRALSPLALGEHAAEIDDLAARALARNVFYEAAFLAHAAHHLRDDGRPQIVGVWTGGDAPRLIGLLPVVTPRFAFVGGKARGWLSHYMVDGAPLLDAACAADALGAFLAWLGCADRGAAAMLFPGVDADGPFAALLREVASRDGLAFERLSLRTRAVLRPRAEAGSADERAAGLRARKELQRQERRLMESGALTQRVATSRADVRDAFEHFLALEARGWKGRAGTAMMQDPSAAAFARSAMRALAGEGRCRIDLLELDGAPIAATIELRAGATTSFWKIAYDEQHARFSPGVQLAARLSARHLAEGDAGLVDSCAETGHPMIDRLWTERMRVVDLVIGTTPERASAAGLIVRRERLRRAARDWAKRAYKALRRR
jgi:CelD/BcsL family acetyltransferase involved in cellulose biosynthesis